MPKGIREDFAWAAGLFDGEGCLSDGRLILTNTDKSLVARFAAIFPGGLWKTTVPTGRLRRYDYVIARLEPFQHAVASMWAWLSDRRKAAAAKALLTKRGQRLDRWGQLCQKGLHQLSGDNVIVGGRRENGKSFRRCRACLSTWNKQRNPSTTGG